jgi:UDP-glucose 4-epimerase
MQMHFLITGGAGFIGSHLAQRLLDEGSKITIVDDLSTGSEANIAHLRSNPNLLFVRDTVENQATLNLLMSQCDAVYHLASAVGVQLVADDPIRTIRTTVHGTEVVLEAANRFGKPILITSSSEVYGKGTSVPFGEEDDVVMAATSYSRWCYAYSKGVDEFLGLAYFKQYHLPVILARLFNTVGPRQVGMYGMVLPRFAAAALTNQPLTVYGDGKQTRCFCHVADTVEALIGLMNAPNSAGKVFNVGGDEEISMNQLAQRVIELSGSSSKIVHIPYEQAYGHKFDDMMRRVPKLERIRAAIGFKQKYNTDQIIQSVIEDQKRRLGAKSPSA